MIDAAAAAAGDDAVYKQRVHPIGVLEPVGVWPSSDRRGARLFVLRQSSGWRATPPAGALMPTT